MSIEEYITGTKITKNGVFITSYIFIVSINSTTVWVNINNMYLYYNGYNHVLCSDSIICNKITKSTEMKWSRWNDLILGFFLNQSTKWRIFILQNVLILE